MIIRGLSIVALTLALACSARGREFDAESDLGLVAENPAPLVAARNTALLTAALDAQWAGGKIKFVDGHVGPVLYPIRCAAKQFFFTGTIRTGRRIGGAVTRFTRIDAEKGGPVIRLRGTGFILDGINVMGRRWPGDRDLSISGAKSESCIEVEGRAAIATGCHTIRNCLLGEAKYGIRTIPGYYDDAEVFVKDENHADQGVVASVTFAGIESCFRSENQQAVGWSFRDIHADQTASNTDTVLFDIVRGGNIAADNVMLNHSRITVFKVQDYSHNNRRLSCENMRYDGGYLKDAYLTLFQYSGPIYAKDDMSWIRWSVRVTGHIPNFDGTNGKPTYDTSKLIQIADNGSRIGINRSDLLFDIAGLPPGGFKSAGGPWMRPK